MRESVGALHVQTIVTEKEVHSCISWGSRETKPIERVFALIITYEVQKMKAMSPAGS